MKEETQIFGLRLKPTTGEELVKTVSQTTKPLFAVTVNPEILMYAADHQEYLKTLQAADALLVDGVGIALILGLRDVKYERWTGGRLVHRLLQLAHEQAWTVALLGGGEGIAQTAADAMKQRYPRAQIVAESGGQINETGEGDAQTQMAIERLQHANPQIWLIALGHPKQEFLIQQIKTQSPEVKLFVGIGGVLDVWAGKVKPAPTWMPNAGLEWLWRWINEPSRAKRMWTATGGFLWRVCTEKTTTK